MEICRFDPIRNMSGFTDKRLIEFSKNLDNSKKLYNMTYLLNDVGLGKSREYNYRQGYGHSPQE